LTTTNQLDGLQCPSADVDALTFNIQNLIRSSVRATEYSQ